ncbi:hypothetical protein AOQ84DRAFT_414574 [Glonium stellatum]|uniref:FAR-17a/AIG1-like protein n=1 Tax=Glonium stellatum TaxID=574774 RepID=A0A8E2EUP4_9PEZI|nr:hypothetical protein AOQ84DRAFT_414574 [Glonium stellatum]
MSRIYSLFSVSIPFDPTHRFETSPFLHSLVLATIRLTAALYGVIGIIIKLAIAKDESACASFSFFSNITFWGITFYFVFAGMHTMSYALRGNSWLDSWLKWLQLLHSSLYSTIAAFPLLVTIVFWAVQSKPDKFSTSYDAWSNVTRYALNPVFAFFEILISRTEQRPWIHLPCVIILLAGYCGIVYITHATEGFYTYSFMDISKFGPGALARHIVGIGASCTGIFILVRFMICGRLWLTETKLGKHGKSSKINKAVEGQTWIQMEEGENTNQTDHGRRSYDKE